MENPHVRLAHSSHCPDRGTSPLAAAIGLALALASLGTPARAADCRARLRVCDAAGRPLADAEISVEPGPRTLAADDVGEACADTLADGTYTVTARAAGFAPVRARLTLPAAAPLEIALRPALQETVEVTGSRAERDPRTVPYSLSIVGARELEASGADSPAEALRDVPGVQISDTSLAGNKRVGIRGEVGSNVLVLVDGREISEQRSFHGGAPLLLDLAEVDQVEVVRGPSSVVYGSKAIGGTVHFVTRPPAAKRFAGRASLALNSSTRGYDGGAGISGTLPLFDYRASASRSEHGDRRVPDSVSDNAAYSGAVGRLESSGFESDYVTGELGRRWGGSRLAVRYEDFRSSVESHTSDDVLAGGLSAFQLDLPRQDRRVLAATYRGSRLGPKVPSLSLTAYVQRRNRDFDQTLGISQPGFAGPGSNLQVDFALSTVYQQDTVGFLASVEWTPSRRHRVVAGVDLVRDDMDATVSDVTTTTLTFPRLPRPIVESEAESPTSDSRQESAGVFVQDEWTLAPRLKLVLGARYNAFSSALLATTSDNLETGRTRRGRLSGTTSLVFEAGGGAVLRASYSQGYRTASLLELYEGTAHGGGGLLYPNPRLAPETSDNFEVGARVAAGRLTLDAAAFYTRARDYVTTRLCDGDAPCPGPAVTGTDRVYDNVDGARTRGAEVSAALRFDPLPVELFAETTWMHREFETAAFTTARTGFPAWWGRGGLRLGRTSGRDARVFGELTLRAASAADEATSPTESAHYPGWAVLAARAGTSFGARVPVALTVEIGNILDEAHRPAQESLYQPGRYAIARLATRF